ncbi:MAG: hypothetical protein QN152_05015 [Armatimonadota bacterium]|nr:hypothetical protein [Armatimonadota bacterium]MDR7427654.1 hypothetical protein [Armatimonadota bacterium]MDR7464289.1 hypothetical protein [Armatimonadota bacterium]MDR7470173.1 hypothetical protein [Armatimonadota bacterium]MDR7473601.1 hypothetical protein [Armatimonadota bacterium]
MKIQLERQPIVVWTLLHRIDGELPLPPTARISDRLNQARDFLPITNARVYTLDGQLLYEAPVALLNRQQVVMMLEREAS